MKRFLTLGSVKTPAAPETSAATRREEFANTVAALRKATGTTESRIVPCRCARTSQLFSLRFERVSPAHRFQIARIDKDDSRGPVKTAAGVFGRKPTQKSYDAHEFDWTGSQCPYCGDRSGLVYCNECGETVCSGRVRRLPDGGHAFACHDSCGATGSIEPAQHVHGGTGNSRAADQAAQLTGPAATARMLSSAANRRMLGGKTQ
jgi:hypothetical protein